MRHFLLAAILCLQTCLSAGADEAAPWDSKAYMNGVQEQIKKNWHPESGQRRKDTQALIHFGVRRNGKPMQVAVQESSGDKEFDQQAVLTVLRCNFEKLPEAAPNDVFIEFRFFLAQNSAKSKFGFGKSGDGDQGASNGVETAASSGESSPSDSTAYSKGASNSSSSADEPNFDNPFRLIHALMRVASPFVMVILLLVQAAMVIVFLVWLAIERSKLALSRRSGSASPGETSGHKTHDHKYED